MYQNMQFILATVDNCRLHQSLLDDSRRQRLLLTVVRDPLQPNIAFSVVQRGQILEKEITSIASDRETVQLESGNYTFPQLNICHVEEHQIDA